MVRRSSITWSSENGADGWFSWMFIEGGIFLAIWASISLLISLILIAGGVYLFRSGRKDRRDTGQAGGFTKDLLSLVSETRKAS